MLKRLGLRAKIYLVLAFFTAITLGGGSLAMWLTYRMGAATDSVMDIHVPGLQSSREVETSLKIENGLLPLHSLDGDQEFPGQADRSDRLFDEWLRKARGFSRTEQQREILNEIESKYIRYAYSRGQLMSVGESGDVQSRQRFQQEMRNEFPAIRDLLARHREVFERGADEARAEISSQGYRVKALMLTAMPASLILGGILVYMLVNQVLEPIRKLAAEADPTQKQRRPGNEVEALSRTVYGLMEDVDQTQTQLQQSREHLVQSEKLAMVGKLAAGVAHSVRNPLTSVKMRLFSMERTLQLSPPQKEDFDVISEEIRHIDTILQNFLEFSRPPKLKIQKVSPSDVVDMAIQLLRHRIESYGVGVELYRQHRLPEIEADAEQLKEVLVNLIINACEAMGEGGEILIREEEGFAEPIGRVVVVRVSDNGPGIPESIRERVFQPFFSTKEEGTGLGLSIATRIIEDHKGSLQLRSRRGKGATFTITLPCKERSAWIRS